MVHDEPSMAGPKTSAKSRAMPFPHFMSAETIGASGIFHPP
jgi:hypothetical protein